MFFITTVRGTGKQIAAISLADFPDIISGSPFRGRLGNGAYLASYEDIRSSGDQQFDQNFWMMCIADGPSQELVHVGMEFVASVFTKYGQTTNVTAKQSMQDLANLIPLYHFLNRNILLLTKSMEKTTASGRSPWPRGMMTIDQLKIQTLRFLRCIILKDDIDIRALQILDKHVVAKESCEMMRVPVIDHNYNDIRNFFKVGAPARFSSTLERIERSLHGLPARPESPEPFTPSHPARTAEPRHVYRIASMRDGVMTISFLTYDTIDAANKASEHLLKDGIYVEILEVVRRTKEVRVSVWDEN